MGRVLSGVRGACSVCRIDRTIAIDAGSRQSPLSGAARSRWRSPPSAGHVGWLLHKLPSASRNVACSPIPPGGKPLSSMRRATSLGASSGATTILGRRGCFGWILYSFPTTGDIPPGIDSRLNDEKPPPGSRHRLVRPLASVAEPPAAGDQCGERRTKKIDRRGDPAGLTLDRDHNRRIEQRQI